MVKADAYGLGAATVGPALAAAGVRTFFVALAEEGAALRESVGPGPAIHVFAGLMPGEASLFREADLIPCLNSPGQAVDFLRHLAGRPCTLQVDTGMNRLGFEPAELDAVMPDLGRLGPALVISHLACADEPDHPMNAAQVAAMTDFAGRLPGLRRSLAATGGTLLGAPYHFDLVRPGVGIYGGLPFGAAEPVVSLALPVVQVREVSAGEAVGYGAAWIAAGPARIATVSAGYADGILRTLGDGGFDLFADGVRCPVVGRVSMDLVTVDVTDAETIPPALDILGPRQGVDDLARAAGTIGYEILTGLGRRYERVYKGGSQRPDIA